MPPQTFLHIKKKKRKQKKGKSFKVETYKRLSLRSKCYCFSDSKASTEFKNFSCQSMVPDRYFSVFHGPSTLKFILLTLIDHYILCTFCFTSFIWLGAKIKKSKSKWSWQIAKLRIITFHNQFTLVKPLFKELKILPLYNMIQMQNCHLVLSHLSNNLPGTFRDFFKYTNNQYGHSH